MTSPKSNVVYDKLTHLIGVLNLEAFDKLVLLLGAKLIKI
jgi:hypothetical protein